MSTINIPDSDLYIFDLDGTLYDQPKLRKTMAVRLAKYYICHPFRVGELLTVYRFRQTKEKWDLGKGSTDEYLSDLRENGEDIRLDELDKRICLRLAKQSGKDPYKVCHIIQNWIYDNPLNALYEARDIELIESMARLRQKGKKVAILSDYPVAEKIKALGVDADGIYSSADAIIGELKPSPKGIEYVINDFSADKDRVVMIGDRQEKDGLAAQNAGVKAVILPRNVNDRDIIFQ